ncbi:fungal-specific transcription factor domain-containing protein [Mycena haematopus]|nr:fungal-specific transcription factor domain-containing protein [Mycena haematopus]
MFSSDIDDDYEKDFHRKRPRPLQPRACDFCRHRKTQCDGAQTVAGSKCTTCLMAKMDCTYVKPRVAQTPKSYIDTLEARLEHSDAQVRQLRTELANIYFANTPSNTPPKKYFNSSVETEPEETKGSPEPSDRDGLNASLYVMRRTLGVMDAPPPPPHADDLVHIKVAETFTKMILTPRRMLPFVGPSSGAYFALAAIDLKADIKREEREEAFGRSNEPSPDNKIRADSGEPYAGAWTSRRPQYWTTLRMNDVARRASTFKFPPEVLMEQLIDLYFTCQNIYVPVLHRPTFERGITEGLHLMFVFPVFRIPDFFVVLATVLLVCAIGSRWSSDPRMAEKDLACGWEWFDQVSQVGYPVFRQAELYDLQYYCLAAQFLRGSTGRHTSWTFIGVGLRLAQDIGMHRRQACSEVPSIERELFKRAFWVLVCLDRIVSAGMGRTCALQYEDIDIDLPLELDDEYWEHPTHPFQQPPGIPSRVTYFNTYIHLNHILAFSLKTLYSLNKMTSLFSSYEDWDEHAVPELDSALNRTTRFQIICAGTLHVKTQYFLPQSVALHCAYYSLRILIHRPLIPMLRKTTPRGLPSLASCTSAARACANILDCQRRRAGNVPVIMNLPAAFTSAIVLLLNVWSGKRTGLVPDPSREMANVYKCMEVVRLCEARWYSAGLMWDILAELASVGQLKLPNWFSNGRGSGPENEQNNRGGLATAEPSVDSRIHEPQFHVPPGATFGDGLMEPSIFASPPAPDTSFPPKDTFADTYINPVDTELQDMMMNTVDSDMLAMWTNAPRGLEVDDWGTYFSDFSEITQTQGDDTALKFVTDIDYS